MAEKRTIDDTPLSQSIKELLLPFNHDNHSPYLFLWIRETVEMIEAWNEETELTTEELANLEALSFIYNEEEIYAAYQQMTEPTGETAEIIYPVPEMMLQVMRIHGSIIKNEPEEILTKQRIALLEMLATNLNNNEGPIDLSPSLHEFYEHVYPCFSDVLNYSYESLMRRLAEPITKRIVGSIKRKMQCVNRDSGMMLSEEDSCLKTLWDEFCVEVQGEQSIFYESYIDYIERLIYEKTNGCSKDEIIVLWTQTLGYEDWSLSEPDCEYSDIISDNYVTDEVCEYLLQKIIEAADNYSSNRIDEFLHR